MDLVSGLAGRFQHKFQNKQIVVPKHKGHRLQSRGYQEGIRTIKKMNEDNPQIEDILENEDDPNKN